MGVFKNEVGRPTNKTIIIRNVLKGVAVVVVGAGLVATGYFLNDYKKTTETTVKDNNDIVTTTKNNSDNKYENLNFINTTKISDTYLPILDFPEGEIEVKNGEIVLTELDNNKNKIKEYKTTGINSKVKFITYFNVCYWDFPIGPIAALTEDNELYIAEPSSDKNVAELEFKLFEKNITDMLIVTGTNPDQDELYLLTSKNELRRVKTKYTLEGITYDFSNELYENRYIHLGNYHEGGISYLVAISAKDNKISFDHGYDIIDDSNDFVPIKYNGEDIKIKYVMSTERNENQTSSLYIITTENDILKTKTDRNGFSTLETCKECYELKKYNESKVHKVEYEKDNEYGLNIKVMYEDGKTEEFKQMRFYDAENNYLSN